MTWRGERCPLENLGTNAEADKQLGWRGADNRSSARIQGACVAVRVNTEGNERTRYVGANAARMNTRGIKWPLLEFTLREIYPTLYYL